MVLIIDYSNMSWGEGTMDERTIDEEKKVTDYWLLVIGQIR
jgi:hypothetical protein